MLKQYFITSAIAFMFTAVCNATPSGLDFAKAQLAVAEAKDRAAQKLTAGDRSGSAFLTGNWTFTKRVCVTDLSPAAIANPAEVKDISRIYTVFTYSQDGTRRGNIVNADGDPDHHRCLTQTDSSFASEPTDIDLNGLKISEVVVNHTGVRMRMDCLSTYMGPKVADVSMVVKVDKNSFYFLFLNLARKII